MADPTSLSIRHDAVRPLAVSPPADRQAPQGAARTLMPAAGAELAGLRPLGRASPTDFAALPDALHASIASRLEPRDRASLAGTNHGLRRALRPMSVSHQIEACAARVRCPETFGIVLQATQSLVRDDPALLAGPLAALAGQAGHLQSMQEDAFMGVLEASAQVPPEARDIPQAALARGLGGLHVPLRAEACRRLLDAIGALPAQVRSKPLGSVVPQIAALPTAEREAAFETVMCQLATAGASEGSAAVLEALAGQIRLLPRTARLTGFQRLLDAAATHLPGRIVELLEPVIAQLPRDARTVASHELQQSVARLPAREREPAGWEQ